MIICAILSSHLVSPPPFLQKCLNIHPLLLFLGLFQGMLLIDTKTHSVLQNFDFGQLENWSFATATRTLSLTIIEIFENGEKTERCRHQLLLLVEQGEEAIFLMNVYSQARVSLLYRKRF